MRSLQMRVGAVLPIARAVIVEAQNFLVRRGNAADGRAVAELLVGIFVDVVADVEHRVEILLGGEMTVGGEEARGPIGARCKSKAHTVGVERQRARAADRRGFSERDELIVVGLTRSQAVGVELDGEIALRAGGSLVAGDHAAHVGVGRDRALDGN